MTRRSLGAQGYTPVMFNAEGDILFLGSRQIDKFRTNDEFYSNTLKWKDARDGGPALCFLDIKYVYLLRSYCVRVGAPSSMEQGGQQKGNMIWQRSLIMLIN